jgi:hypothetical protein
MKATGLLVLAAFGLVMGTIEAQTVGGWSEASIARATEDCTKGMVATAKEGFARKAESTGDAKAPFPEERARAYITPLCDCIVRKAATTLPFGEWQANPEERIASMLQDPVAAGQCNPVAGAGRTADGQMEGGTLRSMQEDFDRIRLDHAFVIAGLIDEYRTKAGAFPFADGTDTMPVAVVIATPQQEERNKALVRIRVDFALRATGGEPPPRFARVEMRTMKQFQDELGRVLGRAVEVPVDPQQVPVNKPSVYTYVLYRGVYDVSVFLHQEFPFARSLGPYYNKVAIASRSYPPGGFWTAEDLKKERPFVEFFGKPFNRERYTLKTRL